LITPAPRARLSPFRALLQDAAYASLPRQRRSYRRRRILEAGFTPATSARLARD
jgi:hypothetical protein